MKSCLKLTVQKTSIFILFILALTLASGCGEAVTQPVRIETAVAAIAKAPASIPSVIADAATILNRPEVPILCYHQVRNYTPSDSKTAKDYIVPVDAFRDQMKLLADSGYTAILPDQLHEYLITGSALPDKPVLITFDDTRLDQFTAALPELNKHGFKAAFFIMTVSLGKPGYMSKEQVKQLADEGHTIGSHTYDHKNVKKYTVDDWVEQVQKPSKQLQTITGKPVEYFAYPFGLWNKEAIAKLKDHDFKAVFQLSAKRDEVDPLFSVRRIIVPGSWSGVTMIKVMKKSFKAVYN
ncbi:MAG TPA: polysaccharide deacetylase family protein [Chitinophagaceae bacterium]|nr:polysaccharide deacetylase family protein [Chitinophagaceae bacterium]